MKRVPVTIAVRPVFPPTAIPAEDSTYAEVGVVPITAPPNIESESAIKARPIRGILLSFINPASWANPTKVPAVSKKATNKKIKTTAHIFGSVIVDKNLIPTPKVGSKLGAIEIK